MSFKDKLQKSLNQGLNVSREIFDKAKGKAKDLSDTAILKYEISQLKKQEESEFSNLGKEVYNLLNAGKSTVSKKTPSLKKHFENIDDLNQRIAEKNELLKKYDKNIMEN